MPFLRLTHVYTYGGQTCNNVYHYATPSTIPSSTTLLALADQFIATVLPAINAVQAQAVANVAIKSYAPNLGYSLNTDAPGNGALVRAGSVLIPPDIVLILERGLAGTKINAGGANYTGNRPILRGHMALSGLPNDYMGITGWQDGGDLAIWDALEDAMTASLPDGAGNDWLPVVVGKEIPASGTKDYRPYSYAQIIDLGARQYSNLDTRDL